MSNIKKIMIAAALCWLVPVSLVWAVHRVWAASNVATSSDGGKSIDMFVSAALTPVLRVTGVVVSPGTITLGTKDVTATVTGVLTDDQLLCSLLSTSTLTNASMTGCTAIAANTVSFHFETPIALGVTLGSMTYNVTVFR